MIRVAKVLVVGDFISLIHEEAICRAFEDNQLEVHRFKFSSYFKSDFYFYTKLNNFQLKYTIGPIISKINNDLFKHLSNNDYDFVFFYRPRIIRKSLLKFIYSRTIVYFYNNDDPFGKNYKRYFWYKYFKGLEYCHHIFYYRNKNKLDYSSIGYNNITLLRSYYIKSINFPIYKKKEYDVVFVGHFEDDGRDLYLKYLIDNGINLKIFGPEWHRCSNYDFFVKRIGEIHSLSLSDYNIVLNSSKIALVFLSTLNSDSYTRRCFEIPATNSFMLAQFSDDLSGLFKPGLEADYFYSKESLLSKVNFYLQNDKAREIIANSGFKRVVYDLHEVTERVKIILNQFNVDIKK
jgi:spore maturation protein CgeB